MRDQDGCEPVGEPVPACQAGEDGATPAPDPVIAAPCGCVAAEAGGMVGGVDDRATEMVAGTVPGDAGGVNAAAVAAVPVTHDPDLRLLTADGTSIRALRLHGNRHSFLVPAGAGALRLLSRMAVRSEAAGPSGDGPRASGVKVGEITVWGRRSRTAAAAHLEAAELPGWFALESGAHRWTDGDAVLPLPASSRPVLVEIEVVAAGSYPLPAPLLADAGHPLA